MFDLKSIALSGSVFAFGIAATFLVAALKAVWMLVDQQAILPVQKVPLHNLTLVFLAACLFAGLICAFLASVARLDD